MTDKRWLRLKAIHERVFELPLGEARAFVQRELADDAELAQDLISLLEQKREGTAFLQFDDAPSRPSTLPPHTRLGDYELLHEIGRGGMGFVYMARHLPLERDVALKVLHPALGKRPEHVARFRREAQRLAKFKHPGIVPIFDVQTDGHVHFFAMEYVDGLDLHRELVCQKKQLDATSCKSTLPACDSKEYFKTVADIVKQAATALADAHEHQITHRDVKPHNMILGRDGRLRLVDFGIARDDSMGSMSESDEVSGTLYYMSPEQTRLTRKRVVDHRTDIYSLGVVMYELLTLLRPFDGPTQTEILKAIEQREPKPVRDVNPRVPRDLAVICHKAMEKLVADRYASARDFAADLERYLAGEAIQATPPTLHDLGRRFVRRRRLEFAGAGLAIVAVGSGFTLNEKLRVDPNLVPTSFVYEGPRGEVAPRRLSYQVIDPISARVSPLASLGEYPFPAASLPVGLVRLRVEYPGGPFKELTRVLRADAGKSTLELPQRQSLDDAAAGDAGMVRIAGGTLRRREDLTRTLCPNLGQDIQVDDFLLDAHEVTVREYREWLRQTKRAPPKYWELFGEDPEFDNRPVILVSYADMQAFAEDHGKRLPTHAEWEWAARGPEDRRTPTGAEITDGLRIAFFGEGGNKNTSTEQSIALWKEFTRDVGTSEDDVTPQGVHDMLGNVREATESLMVDVLAKDKPQVMPNAFLILGGSWFDHSNGGAMGIHYIDGTNTGGGTSNGFRCARSLP